MRIDILTLFPEMFAPLNESIIKRARDKGVLQINTINIRDYSLDKHLKCDDAPFGGGAGMIMTPQPVCDCIKSVDPDHEARRIYLSPRGKLLTADIAKKLAGNERLLLLCGHYEGIDQRIIDLCIDEELSIGDYVLTGGELPAMILTDVVARFVPGVLGCADSAEEDSFGGFIGISAVYEAAGLRRLAGTGSFVIGASREYSQVETRTIFVDYR